MIDPGALDDAIADTRSRVAFNAKRIRKAKGWRQRDVARLAGLDHNTVCQVELERSYKFDVVCRVAAALGVTLADLLAAPGRSETDRVARWKAAAKRARWRAARVMRRVSERAA